MTDDRLTPTEKRLIEAGTAIRTSPPASGELDFLHTILCQTGLPYRDPGQDQRTWDQRQGNAVLAIEAGRIMDPETGDMVPVGLPFGEKARLVLIHLTGEALRVGSPEVEVEGSLTAFVGAIGLPTDGRTIRTVKDQLGRLSAATVRMAYRSEGRAMQVNSTLVRGMDLWAPSTPRQRVLWPSKIVLSDDFFRSIQNHAVPLDRRAISSVKHSAMALDAYCWLAQRLHRIEPGEGQLLRWANLHEQFGAGFKRVRKFREKFAIATREVLLVYPAARIETAPEGLILHHSPPPVPLKWIPAQPLPPRG